MIGILLSLVTVVLLIVDVRKTKEHEPFLLSKTTNLIKGFAAIVVFVHHIALSTDGGFMNHMNYPSVAVFFFVSGYVTMYGYVRKESYIRKILKEKIPTIILYSLLSVCLTVVFLVLIKYPITIRDVALCFTGNRVLNWFFTSLIIKYLLFCLAAFFTQNKGKKFLIAELLLVTIYMIVCWLVGLGASWYCSSLAFPLGSILFYLCETRETHGYVNLVMWGGYRKYSLLIFGTLFLISFLCKVLITSETFGNILRLGASLISALAFSLLCIIFFANKKSKSIFFLCGKYSAQILFMQNISLYLFHNDIIRIENNYLYTLFTVIAEVFLVWGTKYMYKGAAKIVKDANG